MRPIQLIFGTRPEAIKLAPLALAIRERGLPTSVVVTGQHRGMLDQVLEAFDITPDHDLNVMAPNQSLEALTARLLTQISAVISAEKPSVVIVQGDTTTAMTGALAAFYSKVPIGHVEAGLRSGNMQEPWPEEANRKIISAIADYHFAPTSRAAQALLDENVSARNVFVTGNTVIDALKWMNARIDGGQASSAEADEIIAWAGGRRLVLVTCHRRENFGEPLHDIIDALLALSRRSDVAIVMPVHLNPNVSKAVNERLGKMPSIRLLPPLDYLTMIRLMSACDIVLTDSGGLQEEAPAFGKPVLVMRNTTERPEGVDAGTARLVGTSTASITHAVMSLLDDSDAYLAMAKAHNPFGDGTSCKQILDILMDQKCLV